MSVPGSAYVVDYISLVLLVICAVFFTLLYWWRRDIPLCAMAMVFWFISAMYWLIVTTTPGTSLLFWGLGLIMLMYLVAEIMGSLGWRRSGSYEVEEEEEDYERF